MSGGGPDDMMTDDGRVAVLLQLGVFVFFVDLCRVPAYILLFGRMKPTQMRMEKSQMTDDTPRVLHRRAAAEQATFPFEDLLHPFGTTGWKRDKAGRAYAAGDLGISLAPARDGRISHISPSWGTANSLGGHLLPNSPTDRARLSSHQPLDAWRMRQHLEEGCSLSFDLPTNVGWAV
ncbi:hypothetical protein ACRALDRAFT_208805 [Sodiomyces alcalophilus JCM 7366]|uniref:uncharacterized protein n=1 Tax=Sodiomyces alcalophilus JCM 7366 TaxID=591952 RepID=UPI0039B3CAC4